MDESLDQEAVVAALNRILESELSGVVRYTHSSLMVAGPNRIPLVDFFKAQAEESLVHAQEVGEILTGLGGQPSTEIAEGGPNEFHSVEQILQASFDHEREAVRLYRNLLDIVGDRSVFLEEFARGKISAEEQHQLELSKMLRDYA